MKGKSGRKNILISLGLVPLTLFALSSNASAADSTINITGTVVASPCTIEAVKNVDLGDIDASKLAATGSASSFVTVNVNVTNCPATTTKAVATFSGTPSTSDAAYYANSGTAKNVDVELVTSYSSASCANGKTYSIDINSDTHGSTYGMKVRVKNDGKGLAVTPGSVSSEIQMAIAYK